MPAPTALIEVSARIGADPLRVQGPGGNTSQKVGDAIWVKASGTWLAEAAARPIFAELSLPQARDLLDADWDADFSQAMHGETLNLRPSIEAAMHVLMPHAAIIHAHAVNAMTFSVLADGVERVERLLSGLRWAWIPYHRPGAPLAEAISAALTQRAADVLILQNHGVVTGGNTPEAAEALLSEVETRLALPPCPLSMHSAAGDGDATFEALPHLSGVAHDARLTGILADAPLFPDQVVFLGGAVPTTFDGETLAEASERVERASGVKPALLIAPSRGVFARRDRSAAATSVIEGLVEVARRVPDNAPVRGLPEGAVPALLGWDAETYRLGLAKNQTA